jgi:hypothetical protein
VSPAGVRYHPDEWAHDLDEWWSPLTSLAAKAGCASDDWLTVLGVEEFFEPRLLEQARVLTPWICLAASAVAASAARTWAEATLRPDSGPAAWALATAAFDVAAGLERLRWDGRRLGEGVLRTGELIDLGRRAVSIPPSTSPAAKTEPTGLYLAAGWLVHAGGAVEPAAVPAGAPPGLTATPEPAFASIAAARAGTDPIAWGTAHLVERLIDGGIDRGPVALRPDDPPAEARANVLLVAGHGQVGLLETRRQTSLLPVPAGTVVPDLARMAFVHGNGDFRSSVDTAYIAAAKAERVERPGELVSWSIQLPSGTHPLAEKTVSGRSAGLGAYVAFRSLSNPGVFSDSGVAFTGQVSPDGLVGEVESAHDKIEAAHRRRIRLVVHPRGQAWVDPDDIVQLEGVERAEDALIAAAQQLRGLRSYLEAACRLVAPEPWLRTWLRRQGRRPDETPLLTVTCRHLPPREALSHHPERKEPEIPPCPAHQLASLYPGYSFAVSADAGGGNTMAAKRMVALAARRALDGLRALGSEDRFAGFTLPLYVPLGTLPTTWDGVVQASVAALPALTEPGLEVAVALANTLRADSPRPWRALVVVDGTDRTHRSGSSALADRERDFVALVTSSPHQTHPGWRPSRPAQVVLCGRHGSPAHHRAAEALRRERPDAVATMGLDPLTGAEIDRYVASLSTSGTSLTGRARDLATNPLLLTLSVIAGKPRPAGEGDSTDLLDRVIDVLLGAAVDDRRYLAEIAFRAAVAKRQPVGEFTLADIAARGSELAVELALADNDTERAMAIALDRHERQAFQSAEEETHLLTASGAGWRFFHDRAFAFLVADRIARRAAEHPGSGDELFGELGSHLGDALWTDVIEATGRLLELRSRVAPVTDGA